MKTKSFQMRTAIKKLKEGKTIKVADNLLQTVFKARKNSSEVWMHHPGLFWSKYGAIKDFAAGEFDRYFIVVEGR